MGWAEISAARAQADREDRAGMTTVRRWRGMIKHTLSRVALNRDMVKAVRGISQTINKGMALRTGRDKGGLSSEL